MRKARILALAACMAVLAGPALAAPLAPADVAASLRAKGAAQTVQTLWQSGQWSAVERGIASGDAAWIALAPKLAPGSDAATSEGLGITLAFALPRNPAAVLAAMDMRGVSPVREERVCGLPFLEDSEPKGYRDAVMAALSRVKDIKLQDRKRVCLATFQATLAGLGGVGTLTDVKPIVLNPGVNRIPEMVAGADSEGVIIQASHDGSGTADGFSIEYLVLDGGWKTVDVKSSELAPPGDPLIRSVPHNGDDWKRAVVFAQATINEAPAFVMLVAQRDMAKVQTVYDPAPVELQIYRLEPDAMADQDHLVLVDRKRAEGCYANAWLALKDAFGVALPSDYEGPSVSQACPK